MVPGGPRGFSAPAEETLGLFSAFSPQIPRLIPRQGTRAAAARRGGVRGWLWQAPRHLRHKAPGAGAGRAEEQARPGGAAAVPRRPLRVFLERGKGRGGAAPRAVPAAAGPGRLRQVRTAAQSPDRSPAASHLVTLHGGGEAGAASRRRHRPPPSGQETAAAASGPA